jgi:inner membrane protein
MPSIFSHAIFAAAAGRAYTSRRLPLRFWVLTALCAMLPDADAVGFAFGVRYGSMFGHRGITHSIAFSLLAGALAAMLCFERVPGFKRGRLILYFALATFSHPLLDMLTNGGLGVALLAPFSAERYFLPWRPIEVSPIGLGFFSERGLEVMASELVWVWIPAGLLLASATIYCRAQARTRG